jgi:transposase
VIEIGTKDFTVDVPKKRISIKTIGQTKYVYYVMEYYKNKNGYYTNRSISIGKLDEKNPAQFFPNDNYFKYFDVTPPKTLFPTRFMHAGHTVFLANRLQQLDVAPILFTLFPESYTKILQVAIYMMCNGNVMLYMDDFYTKHLNPYKEIIGQRHLSELYEEITKEKRWAFFKEWKNQVVSSDEYIAYDVTSISTYAKDIPFAERGYNRDHELLPQVNVGLFFSQHQKLPVCYELYNGSLTDQTFLPTMMTFAKAFDIQPFLYVMDKGFLNTKNIQYLTEEEIPFLLSAPSHQKVYQEALLAARKEIRQMNNYIDFAGVFGVKTTVTIDQEDYTLFCYFDSEKAKTQERTLFEQIKEREEQLAKQLQCKKRRKKEPYFKVELEDEKMIRFSRNNEAIEEALALTGMFGLLSNQPEIAPAEALSIYRRRNAIESHYDNMKNFLDFDRLHTHRQQTTEGKFFVGFIAQILQADLLRVMNALPKKTVPTIKSLLLELEKIQCVQYEKEWKLMAPITKKQKDILALFDISPETMMEQIIKSANKNSPSV